MKLSKVHIKEFRSILDSSEFGVGETTCLVGKNEAGKTAILQALYRLNPIVESDSRRFDVTHDYPRLSVEDYRQEVESGARQPTTAVKATFELELDEIATVEKDFGKGVLRTSEVTLAQTYPENPDDKSDAGRRLVTVPAIEKTAVAHLCSLHGIPTTVQTKARKAGGTLADLKATLEETALAQQQACAEATAQANQLSDTEQKTADLKAASALAETDKANDLRNKLDEVLESDGLGLYIWRKYLEARCPKFLYFDEFYQMRGHANIPALIARKNQDKLWDSDHPLLGLIARARLNLEDLANPKSTQELKNKLEGASNFLSQKILKYWSQNKHIHMSFDVRPGLPGDEADMRTGFNIWAEVQDTRHRVSTGLHTRSRGFVWFFSFLAWYSKMDADEALVLLLDEPGLSLHGRAQADLLRYFAAEIASNPKHQLLYTTHSPFMVDPKCFDQVLIVQDKGIDSTTDLPPEEDGTKVFSDVLEASDDSLFPLQAALGYELHQALFIGPNCLVVEGASDLLYLQTVSGLLESDGREGLDERWTITPVGGAGKVPTFVALIGAQKGLKVATLIDFQKSDRQMIENLYKKKLIQRTHVRTFADFIDGATEADVEDMFTVGEYVKLINREFEPATKLTVKALTNKSPRLVVRVQDYFTTNPMQDQTYNHYRPARCFAEEPGRAGLSEATLGRFEQAFKALNAIL